MASSACAACHPFANGESDWLAYVNVWESVRLCVQQNGGPTGICCVDLKNWATIVVVSTWPAQTDHMAAGPASRDTCIIIVCISRISYGSQATQGEGEGEGEDERVSARANMHNLLGTPWKRDSVWSRIWQTEKGGKREGYAWIMHATCNDCTEIANEFSRSKNEFPFPFTTRPNWRQQLPVFLLSLYMQNGCCAAKYRVSDNNRWQLFIYSSGICIAQLNELLELARGVWSW